jgi:thermitase
MTRFAALLLMLTSLAVAVPGAGGAPRQPGPAGTDYVPDEILVSIRANVDPALVARLVGGTVARYLRGLDVFRLKVPAGTVDHAVAVLKGSSFVVFAEPNAYVRAFADPDDPYAHAVCYPTSNGLCLSQWAWAKLSAYQAWDLTTGAATVKVAVVDTGIDVGYPQHLLADPTGHEDIVGCRPVQVVSFVSGESGNDDNGHGTHVAGLIGACSNNGIGVSGANWKVQLLGVKALDFSGSGTAEAVAAGIKWSADQGAHVINLSLGGSAPSRTIERAVNYAWSRGAVLVCAAGNAGTTARAYPAAYERCIAVAATGEQDVRASFSSYGAGWVDVAAPGVNILSTMPDNWDWCFLCYWYGHGTAYDALSGTSMAAAHVSGLAALVWAGGGCATNVCVRSRIEGGSDAIAGTGTLWRYGRINYFRAVK